MIMENKTIRNIRADEISPNPHIRFALLLTQYSAKKVPFSATK